MMCGPLITSPCMSWVSIIARLPISSQLIMHAFLDELHQPFPLAKCFSLHFQEDGSLRGRVDNYVTVFQLGHCLVPKPPANMWYGNEISQPHPNDEVRARGCHATT